MENGDIAAAAGCGGMDDGAQCTKHQYRNTTLPGGICALCLQDKLGKLVSSSSSSFTPASSSLPPSSSSNSTSSTLTLLPQLHPHPVSDVTMHHSHNASVYHSHRGSHHPQQSSSLSAHVSNAVLKRSQSISTRTSLSYNEGLTPRRRGFWSFLHLSSAHHKQDRPNVGPGSTPTSSTTPKMTQVMDNNNKTTGSNERKVSRSKSIGCANRGFSSDFLERISTGFSDCALRRVESNREGRRSTSSASDFVKDPARCGGLFGGFIITSSSYWTAIGDEHNVNVKSNGVTTTPGAGPLVHGRSRSWGWVLASPLRVFTKPIITSTTTIKGSGVGVRVGGATETPNLADIPPLLSVR